MCHTIGPLYQVICTRPAFPSFGIITAVLFVAYVFLPLPCSQRNAQPLATAREAFSYGLTRPAEAAATVRAGAPRPATK